MGRLCRWLRILGYDARYFLEMNVAEILITSLREERIILTRYAKFGEHRGARIVNIESDFVKEQLAQVTVELKITPDEDAMFSRCTLCNEEVVEIEKDKVKDRVLQYVYDTNEDFSICPACSRIYWKGTHWGNVAKILQALRWNS